MQRSDNISEHSHTETDSLLGQLAGEYFDRLSRGENPGIEEFAGRHPEIAELIRDVFPALATIGKSNAASDGVPSGLSYRSPKMLGEFRIVREIGRGGMGIVFEAEQSSMGRRVALKVLPFASMLDETRLVRFKNEIRAAATFDHANIVSVYSVGEDQGVHYYAMRLVHGQSMARVIEQLNESGPARGADSILQAVSDSSLSPCDSELEGQGQRAAEEDSRLRPVPNETNRDDVATTARRHLRREFYRSAARLGLQAAEALHHAHERGVVHRDIKPGNLLLDAEGGLWITDFGLARIEADAGLTMSGDVLGTLRYMAPEQALAKHALADHRVDIYSLGATFYELLSLEPAVQGDDRQELLDQIAHGEPLALRKRDFAIPPELETIIGKALEKNPVDRFATAEEMADDLRRYLDNRPIKARRPTLVDRASKLARRHHQVAWAVVVLLLVVTIGSIVGTIGISRLYRETEDQRRLANLQLIETKKQKQIADAARIEAVIHKESLRRELYSLDMTAAFDAWDKRWIEEVERLLHKHKPTDDPPDLRTFGWYALHSLSFHPMPVVMRGHEGAVREVAVHPDGRRIVSVGDDGTIRTWDFETGALLTTIKASTESLNALAISPDGETVATGNQTLELWNLDLGQKIRTLTWHSTTIEEAVFSPDGGLVASGARNWYIHLTSIDGETTHKFQTDGGNESIVFTDDGATIMGVCELEPRNRVRTWDCTTGALVRDFMPSSTAAASIAAPSMNGRRYAIATNGAGRILFCDAESGRELESTRVLRGGILDIALSPDDSILVAAGTDGILRRWRLTPEWTETQVPPFISAELVPIAAHQNEITSVTFVDNQSVITCGADGMIKIWRFADEQGRDRQLDDQFTHVALAPDTKRMLGADDNSTLRLGNIDTGQIDWTTTTSGDMVVGMAFSDDGHRIATFDERNQIDIWDSDSGNLVATFQHGHDLKCVTLSGSGRWLAATAVDGYSCVWDLASGDCVLNHKLDSWGESVIFSPNEKLLALGGRQPEILIFDTATWSIARRLRGTSDVTAMAFRSDGTTLASAHRDAAIRVWDVESGQLSTTLKGHQQSGIQCLVFHPSGETLASGCHGDDSIQLWHLPTRRSLGRIWTIPNDTWIRQLAFSPDGQDFLAVLQSVGREHHTLFSLRTDFPTTSVSAADPRASR